jgi:hypothetical protein
MSKDLARRIEDVEAKPALDATDREYLRALAVRQVVWDRQIMQLAEISDLLFEARKSKVTGKGTPPTPPKPRQSSPRPVQPHHQQKGATESQGAEPLTSAPIIEDKEETSTKNARDDPEADSDAEYEYVQYEPELDADTDEEPDKSNWLLCYRSLDVDPETDLFLFKDVCKK